MAVDYSVIPVRSRTSAGGQFISWDRKALANKYRIYVNNVLIATKEDSRSIVVPVGAVRVEYDTWQNSSDTQLVKTPPPYAFNISLPVTFVSPIGGNVTLANFTIQDTYEYRCTPQLVKYNKTYPGAFTVSGRSYDILAQAFLTFTSVVMAPFASYALTITGFIRYRILFYKNFVSDVNISPVSFTVSIP